MTWFWWCGKEEREALKRIEGKVDAILANQQQVGVTPADLAALDAVQKKLEAIHPTGEKP